MPNHSILSFANFVLIPLGPSVFLWNATSNSISELVNLGDTTVTSVSYSPNGPQYLAVGNENNEIQLWFVLRCHPSSVLSSFWLVP